MQWTRRERTHHGLLLSCRGGSRLRATMTCRNRPFWGHCLSLGPCGSEDVLLQQVLERGECPFTFLPFERGHRRSHDPAYSLGCTQEMHRPDCLILCYRDTCQPLQIHGEHPSIIDAQEDRETFLIALTCLGEIPHV